MPGGPRSFFGCAGDGDGDRTVFVAGGHDLEKNALKSVWAYDVAKDNWTQLLDIANERDECEGLFLDGKFHVINGYPTNMQGQFHQSIEVFDMLARKWSESNDVLSESTYTPQICVKGTDKKLYTCRANDMVVLEDDTWQSVARLPAEATNMHCLVSFLGHLLLIGTPKYGEPSNAYMMDLNKRVWTKVHVPVDYSGHIESSCCLII
ncbi:putative kelch-type beta propeller [Helianthus anomalus]